VALTFLKFITLYSLFVDVHAPGDNATWPTEHRLKEAQRALQVRAVKGVAENQKSERAGGNSRC
jgi:hypothetical protein